MPSEVVEVGEAEEVAVALAAALREAELEGTGALAAGDSEAPLLRDGSALRLGVRDRVWEADVEALG